MLKEARLNKVGIDRVVINNFKFWFFRKKQINSNIENIQKLEKKTEFI